MDIFLLILIILIPMIANIKINSSYNKYSKIKCSSNITGKDVAKRILDKNGLNNISINEKKAHNRKGHALKTHCSTIVAKQFTNDPKHFKREKG